MEGKYRGGRQRIVQQKEQKRARFPVEDGRAIMSSKESTPVENVNLLNFVGINIYFSDCSL